MSTFPDRRTNPNRLYYIKIMHSFGEQIPLCKLQIIQHFALPLRTSQKGHGLRVLGTQRFSFDMQYVHLFMISRLKVYLQTYAIVKVQATLFNILLCHPKRRKFSLIVRISTDIIGINSNNNLEFASQCCKPQMYDNGFKKASVQYV